MKQFKFFTVTPEHIKLAQNMYVGYDEYTEFGAPCVDPKRPYGNSDVYGDMAKILGIDETESQSSKNIEYMYKLHREMQTVLQILVRNLNLELGVYKAEYYRENWEPVEDGL